MKVKVENHISGETSYWLWCPACEEAHRLTNAWQFDGNLELPTFSPSIMVVKPEGLAVSPRVIERCHSFVRWGRWEYLADCDHALAGKTIPVVDLPSWLADA